YMLPGLSSGRNCNRPYGSRAAQPKSVPTRTASRQPEGHETPVIATKQRILMRRTKTFSLATSFRQIGCHSDRSGAEEPAVVFRTRPKPLRQQDKTSPR